MICIWLIKKPLSKWIAKIQSYMANTPMKDAHGKIEVCSKLIAREFFKFTFFVNWDKIYGIPYYDTIFYSNFEKYYFYL